jgi:hypothetical protein
VGLNKVFIEGIFRGDLKKKMETFSEETGREMENGVLTAHHWEEMDAIGKLPLGIILNLLKHLLRSIQKNKGMDGIVALQSGITDYLYPSPHMLAWAEGRLKKRPEMTPSQLAYQYAGVVLKNKKAAPTLIRDMQKLKTRLQMQEKRAQWRRLSGRKVNERMKMPKPRIPGNAAYFEKVIFSRLTGKDSGDIVESGS